MDRDMYSHGVAKVTYDGDEVTATCICGKQSQVYDNEATARAEIEDHANGSH